MAGPEEASLRDSDARSVSALEPSLAEVPPRPQARPVARKPDKTAQEPALASKQANTAADPAPPPRPAQRPLSSHDSAEEQLQPPGKQARPTPSAQPVTVKSLATSASASALDSSGGQQDRKPPPKPARRPNMVQKPEDGVHGSEKPSPYADALPDTRKSAMEKPDSETSSDANHSIQQPKLDSRLLNENTAVSEGLSSSGSQSKPKPIAQRPSRPANPPISIQDKTGVADDTEMKPSSRQSGDSQNAQERVKQNLPSRPATRPNIACAKASATPAPLESVPNLDRSRETSDASASAVKPADHPPTRPANRPKPVSTYSEQVRKPPSRPANRPSSAHVEPTVSGHSDELPLKTPARCPTPHAKTASPEKSTDATPKTPVSCSGSLHAEEKANVDHHEIGKAEVSALNLAAEDETRSQQAVEQREKQRISVDAGEHIAEPKSGLVEKTSENDDMVDTSSVDKGTKPCEATEIPDSSHVDIASAKPDAVESAEKDFTRKTTVCTNKKDSKSEEVTVVDSDAKNEELLADREEFDSSGKSEVSEPKDGAKAQSSEPLDAEKPDLKCDTPDAESHKAKLAATLFNSEAPKPEKAPPKPQRRPKVLSKFAPVEEEQAKRKPPPKPPRRSKPAVANLFEAAVADQDAEARAQRPRPAPASSKIGALHSNLVSSLNTALARGPPGARSQSRGLDDEETKSNETLEQPTANPIPANPRARAKPQRRRLPGAAQETWTTVSAHLWHVEEVGTEDKTAETERLSMHARHPMEPMNDAPEQKEDMEDSLPPTNCARTASSSNANELSAHISDNANLAAGDEHPTTAGSVAAQRAATILTEESDSEADREDNKEHSPTILPIASTEAVQAGAQTGVSCKPARSKCSEQEPELELAPPPARAPESKVASLNISDSESDSTDPEQFANAGAGMAGAATEETDAEPFDFGDAASPACTHGAAVADSSSGSDTAEYTNVQSVIVSDSDSASDEDEHLRPDEAVSPEPAYPNASGRTASSIPLSTAAMDGYQKLEAVKERIREAQRRRG